MLDHLGVVVGGQERLALAAVLHREPADEVRQPDVGGALLLGVLVQVVVELPRLVADPEVVVLLAHEVVEDHVVGEQDLVHPADRLEAVQVVLGRLALDVGRLVGQQRAGGVDALAPGLEHLRDRCWASQSISRSGWSLRSSRRSPRRAARGRGRSARRCRAPACVASGLRPTGAAAAGDHEVAQQLVDLDGRARAGHAPSLRASPARRRSHRRARCRGPGR